MQIIFIKNCDEYIIPHKYIDKSSWFIDSTYNGNIVNSINYTKLNDDGEKFMDYNHILGFDVQKQIYLKKNFNTIIKRLHYDNYNFFDTFTNKIYKNEDFCDIDQYFNLIENINFYDYVVFE